MKKIATILGTAIAAVSLSGVANAASLAPSSFVTLTGTADNAATPAGALNTTASPDGFSSFFGANYVAIGSTGTQTVSAGPEGVNSVVGAPLPVTASDIAAGSLIATFNYAFAGVKGGGADNFSVQLFNQANSFVGSFFNRSSIPLQNNFLDTQVAQNGTVSLAGQTAGTFQVRLVLNEGAFDSGNTAAGFNTIDISAPQAIPFEFSPLGLVALGGAYYFVKKNKKAKSEISA